jgi:hypothetical protein
MYGAFGDYDETIKLLLIERVRAMAAEIKVLSRRWYKVGYEVRKEVRNYGTKKAHEVIGRSAYSPSGDYIGNPRMVKHLTDRGITIFEKGDPNGNVCILGFNPEKQIWYGWSHRAITGFRLGDKIFNEKFGDNKTPFRQHGNKTIETLADAKLAALRFARSVG